MSCGVTTKGATWEIQLQGRAAGGTLRDLAVENSRSMPLTQAHSGSITGMQRYQILVPGQPTLQISSLPQRAFRISACSKSKIMFSKPEPFYPMSPKSLIVQL